jgi:hypothetical protein
MIRMKSDILIISDALIEPPSESFAFRTVTMISHDALHMQVLVHTTQDMKDFYYHWMKPRGLMDYVSYILNEQEWETGLRVDVERYYPDTLITKAITLDNQIALLGMIKCFSGR